VHQLVIKDFNIMSYTLFTFILILIYLSTAIGLTPGGSGTVHTINLRDFRLKFCLHFSFPHARYQPTLDFITLMSFQTSSPNRPDQRWGPTQPMSTAESLLLVKLLREVDHSPPSGAKIKIQWSYTSTPSNCQHGVMRDTFASHLYNLRSSTSCNVLHSHACCFPLDPVPYPTRRYPTPRYPIPRYPIPRYPAPAFSKKTPPST